MSDTSSVNVFYASVYEHFRVICVVGAGRGPLVAGCLRATKNSGRFVKMYAVEKNPNAFVTFVSPFFSFSFIQSIIAPDRLPVDCKSAKNTSGSGV